MGVARRRCKVGVNAGCKGSKDQTGHGRKKHWSYYQLKSEKARPHGYLLGIGHRALGIGGEGDVRLPATGMLLLYSVSQEGADKRRQQWMIHEQPDGEGVVGSRSSAAAKIQKMPEWLERKKKRAKESNPKPAPCVVPTLARCWLRIIIIAAHLPQARAKKVPENIVFSSSSASVRLELHQKVGFASSSFHATVVHTPLPPMSNLEKWLLGSLTQFIL